MGTEYSENFINLILLLKNGITLFYYITICSDSDCILIEFIEVTLVNKITEVSGAQFHSTLSLHSIVCLPPQAKSPSITILSCLHP